MIAADDLMFACLIYVVIVGCITLLCAFLRRKEPKDDPEKVSRTGLIIALVAGGIAVLLLWAISASL